MNYYLSLAALVPAVILFVRIYQLDRIEKEPHRLLGTLILCGAGVGRRTEPALGGVFAAG